jgi:hypothetical protein
MPTKGPTATEFAEELRWFVNSLRRSVFQSQPVWKRIERCQELLRRHAAAEAVHAALKADDAEKGM